MQAYDAASGQVYVETVAPVQSMTRSWMNHVNRKTKDPKTYRSSGKGVTSLREIALRHCVFHTFDADTFEGVPWHIAEMIYNRLKDTSTFTASLWIIFRTVYPSETVSNYRLSLPAISRSPPLQLHSISSGLKTIPFPCLTFLSIQDLSISSSDIISLILPIPSLAVLELRPYHIGSVFSSIYHDEGIDERGMRTWIRAVREGKSLRDLKVLVLRLMDVDQGWDDILSDLFTELPSLQLLRLETKRSKCNVEVMAENNSENTTPKRNWSRVKLFEIVPNPEIIYSSPHTTTTEKLEALYQIPLGNVHPPDSASKPNSISIAYGTPHSVIRGGLVASCSAWFIKNTNVSSETKRESKNSVKRKADGKDSGLKKRKVREGKKSNLGSLLNSFQGS